MMRLCSLLAVSMGIGLLATGCLAQSEDVNALDEVALESMGGDGSEHGGNGLASADWIAARNLLWDAASGTFTDANVNLAALTETKSGVYTLEYATTCALPANLYTLKGLGLFGQGFLSTTSDWVTTPLVSPASSQPKYDLMECMSARVNAYGMTVAIRLSGENIVNADTPSEVDDFTYGEALWLAYEDSFGRMVLDVFPLPALVNSCGALTADSVRARVCGTESGSVCGVNVRDDLATACVQDPVSGSWRCDGKPVIASWLEASNVNVLLPRCF